MEHVEHERHTCRHVPLAHGTRGTHPYRGVPVCHVPTCNRRSQPNGRAMKPASFARNPCGGCMYEARCGSQRLACLRLLSFLTSGRWSPTTPRAPSAALYERVQSTWGSEATQP
jgi:hypothetical protein